MFEQNRSSALRSAAVLALCALFFLLAMGIALFGSRIYRGAVRTADANDVRRTALSYLVNQIRRNDTAGGVRVGSFDGLDTIVLADGGYVTYLYCLDGQLRELYMEAGADLAPEAGLPVLPADSLAVTVGGGRMTLTVTDADGTCYQTSVSPRCGVGEAGSL